MASAGRRAEAACHELFRGQLNLKKACDVGAEVGIAACEKEKRGMKGLSGRKDRSSLGLVVRNGKSLGFFNPCDEPCPSGTERVTIRKFKATSQKVLRKKNPREAGTPALCVCRLDPKTRKKHRDEAQKVTRAYEDTLKPFGSEKKPIHLRRCIRWDKERNRCAEKGEPIVITRGRAK